MTGAAILSAAARLVRPLAAAAGLLTCLAASALPASADRIYVAPWGSDTQPGTSWKRPFRSPARACESSSGARHDEIWVAKSTYATASLPLKAGVQLLGGFAGKETQASQRDPKKNVTVLRSKAGATIVTVEAGAAGDTRIDGFTLERVRGQGAALLLTSASPTVANNVFQDNLATNAARYGADGAGGAAILCRSEANAVILHNTFEDNAAQRVNGIGGDGGAIRVAGASPMIEGNAFVNNQADSRGGAVWVDDGAPVVRANQFYGNAAQIGGALYLAGCVAEVANNDFRQNTAVGGAGLDSIGGAVFLSSGPAESRIHDNLLAGNAATGGSALFSDGGLAIFANNTVAQNRSGRGSGKKGGAVSAVGSSSVGFFSNIVAFNDAGFSLLQGSFAFSANDVFRNIGYAYDPTGAGPGASDFSVDPLFVDRIKGDFHLQARSRCVDAGDNGRALAATDLEGDPRPYGPRVDVGADEFCARVMRISITPNTLCGGLTANVTVLLSSPAPAGGTPPIQITSDDPTLLTVPASVTVPAGQRTVTFTVTAKTAVKGKRVTLAARLGSTFARGTARVLPWLAGSELDTDEAEANQELRGTVTLNCPAHSADNSGKVIGLSCDNPAVILPRTLRIPEGETSAEYTFLAPELAQDTVIDVTASLEGVSKTSELTVYRFQPNETELALSCDPPEGPVGSTTVIAVGLGTSDGEPIPFATVVVTRDGDPQEYRLTTDEDGYVEVEYPFPSPAGTYSVHARYDGDHFTLPSRGDATLRSRRALSALEVEGPEGPGEIGSIFTVYVSLVTEDGTGVPFAPLVASLDGAVLDTWTTDEEGALELELPFPGPAGIHQLTVNYAGSTDVEAATNGFSITSLVCETYTGADDVEGADRETVLLSVYLSCAEGGLAGQTLDFYVMNDRTGVTYVGSAVTDSDGAAVLSYALREWDTGYYAHFKGVDGWYKPTNPETEAVASIIPVESESSIAIRFESPDGVSKTRYKRGEKLNIFTRLTSVGGDLAGHQIILEERSTKGTKPLGTFKTDAQGRITVPYAVPLDPNKDNIVIWVIFAGDEWHLPGEASKRIPIG
jgi:hypothetical protein